MFQSHDYRDRSIGIRFSILYDTIDFGFLHEDSPLEGPAIKRNLAPYSYEYAGGRPQATGNCADVQGSR